MPQSKPVEHRCRLCERRFEDASSLTDHHLLPRAEGGKTEHIADFCRLCHSTVHATFSNRTLADSYANVEALKAAPELQGYLKWVRRQDPGARFKTRTRKDRR
jgi:5-methylcytosine-specific restriction enzyme A